MRDLRKWWVEKEKAGEEEKKGARRRRLLLERARHTPPLSFSPFFPFLPGHSLRLRSRLALLKMKKTKKIKRHQLACTFFSVFFFVVKKKKKHNATFQKFRFQFFFFFTFVSPLSLDPKQQNQSTLSNTARHSTWSAPGKKIRAAPCERRQSGLLFRVSPPPPPLSSPPPLSPPPPLSLPGTDDDSRSSSSASRLREGKWQLM